MGLRSFSLVGTGNLSKEVGTCIYSIRRFYDLPIYIIGDDELIEKINNYGFTNVHMRNWANPEMLEKIDVSSVQTPHETYHDARIIYCKFDALEWAVLEKGNSLFIDSDIILVDEIDKNISGKNTDAILSPHYYGDPNRRQLSLDWGAFNAGYLFASKPEVASAWRRIYLGDSKFYEQEGMRLLFNEFDCYVFNRCHNFGFWRFEYTNVFDKASRTNTLSIPYKFDLNFVKSFHIRLQEYDFKDPYIKKRFYVFYNAVKNYIPEDIRSFQ